MPELPEVETIKRAVDSALCGAVITNVTVYQRQMREKIEAEFEQHVRGARIVQLGRKAKYMLMYLDNGYVVIWHFGMSGTIRIEANLPAERQKHDHVIIETTKGVLIYNDPRRFGLVTAVKKEDLPHHHLLGHLGPDPWDKEFTPAYLRQKFIGKKTAVKVALLDQDIVCGVGNIYASEILYRARILPQRPAESITAAEANRIVEWTQKILESAIAAGGSSIHDYVHPDGNIGYFQESHCVYNKTGLRCPQCRCCLAKTGGIQKIVLGGRSTFYCATRQK